MTPKPTTPIAITRHAKLTDSATTGKLLATSLAYDSMIRLTTKSNSHLTPLAQWNLIEPAQADGLNWYGPFAANTINREDRWEPSVCFRCGKSHPN